MGSDNRLLEHAIAAHRAGDLEQARALYERVLSADPDNADALHLLGLIVHGAGDHRRAIGLIGLSVRLEPRNAAAHTHLAQAYLACDEHDQAERSFRTALDAASDYMPAREQLARLCFTQHRYDEALQHFAAVADGPPQSPVAYVNLAVVLGTLGRDADARSALKQALAIDSNLGDAWFNLAQLLDRGGDFAGAEEAFRRVATLQPERAEAWYRLGGLAHAEGRLEARDYLERAVQLEPDNPEFLWVEAMARIPVVYGVGDDPGRVRESFASRLAGLENAHRAGTLLKGMAVGSMQPFYLAFQPIDNRPLLDRYGDLCAALMSHWRHEHVKGAAGSHRARDRIRIGIVSGHFFDQSVWTAIVKGWCLGLDRQAFEIDAFHTGEIDDQETTLARSLCDRFHSRLGSLPEWVGAIVDCGPDVLLYPEIGMDRTTVRLASMKLAPLQWASWGHPETTGLPTIDAYLSAEGLEPQGAGRNYRERLLLLPNLGCRYQPLSVPDATLDGVDLSAVRERPMLLCAGSPYKYLPDTDGCLAAIAGRLPQAVLVFFTDQHAGATAQLISRMRVSFARAGVQFDRHAIVLPRLDRPRFFALMRRAHLFVDTIGFSGFNTAMQAIECGLPVVAYEGQFLRGRLASGILRRIGMHQWVARSPSEFVERVVEAAVPESNRQARRLLAARRKVLFDDEEPVRALSGLLREAVRSARH